MSIVDELVNIYDKTNDNWHIDMVKYLLDFDCDIILMRLKKYIVEKVKLISSQSYLHPLGFHKVVLYIRDSGFSIRLHVWERGLDSNVDIHNHKGDLLSFVLRGKINVYEYDIQNIGGDYNMYELTRDPKFYDFQLMNKVSIKTKSSYQVEKYSFYKMKYDVLHKSVNLCDDISVTLVIFDDFVTDKTNVLSRNVNFQRDSAMPQRFSETDLKKIIKKI